jgi:regulator of PEP synthase PpsR (kinase-PPPase family)
MNINSSDKYEPHTVLIVSGGAGTSGEQIVHTVLAQFPDRHVQVITVPNVRFKKQIDEVVERARGTGATLTHTLVDAGLRDYLTQQAEKQGVAAIDLMGPLIGQLARVLGQEALGEPGLYRKLNKAYFDRVAAIEFTMAHDDGKNPETWSQAEIVLVGVSRAGKTPLSLYLSVLGWKVANIPIVPGLVLPSEFSQINPQKAFGLKIAPGQLLLFRQQRQQRLGISGPSDYTNPERLTGELEYALEIIHRSGFTTIDVTDKPIESCADEVIRLVTARSRLRDRPG